MGRFWELLGWAFPGWRLTGLLLWLTGVILFAIWYQGAVFWGQVVVIPAVGIAWFFLLAAVARFASARMKKPPAE